MSNVNKVNTYSVFGIYTKTPKKVRSINKEARNKNKGNRKQQTFQDVLERSKTEKEK